MNSINHAMTPICADRKGRPGMATDADGAAPCETPRLVRVWDMPHKHTFLIPTVQCLLRRFVSSGKGWADPFANNRSPAEHTNDINPETSASSHMDAVDFLKTFTTDSLNGVLLDPPYSMHQCTASYDGYGTGRVNSLTPVYDQVARIVGPHGLTLSFGWNSNGIGAGRGFELLEVVLIPHGGHHNDTIVTVERKVPNLQGELLP